MKEKSKEQEQQQIHCIGIDDAGRGPIIGPMILSGVLLTKEQEALLKKGGAKDSKMLTHPMRVKLAKLIKKNCLSFKVVKAYPDQIDSYVKGGTNLNTLEAEKAAEIINALNSGKAKKTNMKVILDCPSVNTKTWLATLSKSVKDKENLSFICEHKADVNHVSVSAASILSKVEREIEMDKIRKQFSAHGNVGSGYPADPITQEFLKTHGKTLKDSGIFRKSWQTWKDLFGEEGNSSQSKLF